MQIPEDLTPESSEDLTPESFENKLKMIETLGQKGLIRPEAVIELQVRITSQYLNTKNTIFIPQYLQKIFISYSHDDVKWFEILHKHLKPFKLDMIWDDTLIKPGANWKEEIKKALISAKAAILLISPNFFASDFISNEELPILLEAAKRGGLRILWIAVSASGFKATEIKDYQGLNDPEKPLNSLLNEAELNRELVRICEKINSVINPSRLQA